MKPTPLLILTALVCGCSTAPRHTEHAPPIVARNENAPAAAPAANGATAAPPGADQDLLRQGYHITHRRGEMLYCKQQAMTGTRFMSNVCLTEEQIKDDQRRAQEELGRVHAGACLTHSCND